ncbi:Uncharacterized protein Adt_27963 [Abeliophyllum distichum]|uniref:Uncharacterized protein n=1 Tax=Abeliophyllum distichum TaxID=126358 RepID=A0ABD1RV77_9LAMI
MNNKYACDAGMDTATACFHAHLFLNIQKAFDLNIRRMEAIQQLDLKSDEAEKSGLSETSVYLIKNTGIILIYKWTDMIQAVCEKLYDFLAGGDFDNCIHETS